MSIDTEFGEDFHFHPAVAALLQSGEADDTSWHNDENPSIASAQSEDDGPFVKLYDAGSDDPAETNGARFAVLTYQSDCTPTDDQSGCYEGNDAQAAVAAYRAAVAQLPPPPTKAYHAIYDMMVESETGWLDNLHLVRREDGIRGVEFSTSAWDAGVSEFHPHTGTVRVAFVSETTGLEVAAARCSADPEQVAHTIRLLEGLLEDIAAASAAPL